MECSSTLSRDLQTAFFDSVPTQCDFVSAHPIADLKDGRFPNLP
jgi:hypothetical protein